MTDVSKHTPAPWTIEEYGDDETPALVIHKDSETRICFMATPGSHGDPEKIEADAHLIAAAPDLLEALKESVAEVEQSKNDIIAVRAEGEFPHPKFDAVSQGELARLEAMLVRIRAAIAKAEGH